MSAGRGPLSQPEPTLAFEELLERPAVEFGAADLPARLAGRRVLVTGAGGSVGSALASLLAAWRPAALTLLESHEPSLFHLRARLLAAQPDGHYTWTLADVRDERKLAAVCREARPELVFHLAAYKHVPLGEANLDQVVAVNVGGALRVVEAAARAGAAVVVYPSTDKAVNPPSVYGATKRVVERYLDVAARAAGGTALRYVRLVNVFGTQGSVVETFARQLAADEPLTITDPRMTRYWMTMREAALLLAWAAVAPEAAAAGGPFILAVGEAVPLEQTARRVARLLRPEAAVRLRYVGIRPGERLHEELAYPYEALVPSPQPGVLLIRDQRGPAAGAPELLAELRSLLGSLDELERAELRRWLFRLAV